MLPGVPSGHRGNWEYETLRDRSHACFAKKALKKMKFRAFPELVGPEFCRLKALITLEQVNTSVVGKKREELS